MKKIFLCGLFLSHFLFTRTFLSRFCCIFNHFVYRFSPQCCIFHRLTYIFPRTTQTFFSWLLTAPKLPPELPTLLLRYYYPYCSPNDRHFYGWSTTTTIIIIFKGEEKFNPTTAKRATVPPFGCHSGNGPPAGRLRTPAR